MKKNFLIVDDSQLSLTLITGFLKKKEYVNKIFTATSGNEAIEILKKEKIDFLFSDDRMENGDAFSIIQHCTKSGIEIPIIIFSNNDYNKTKLLENGANYFISKPITKDNLFYALDMFLDI